MSIKPYSADGYELRQCSKGTNNLTTHHYAINYTLLHIEL